jgi:rubrerythrin
LKFLNGASPKITIQVEIPTFAVGKTVENLKFAAAGEHEERAILSPQFANIGQEEGFPMIAEVFKASGSVEAAHERRFGLLVRQVESETVFKRDRVVSRKCRNCGYIQRGKEAPVRCPAC